MPGTNDTAASLQEADLHTAAYERWIAEVDGQVVGSIVWFHLANRFHPHKFWMDGAVHPDFQALGVGSALLGTLLAAITPRDPISLRTRTREDYEGACRFLRKHGFVDVKLTLESFLDLTTLNLEPYADLDTKTEVQGIRIRPLSELQGLTGWEQRALDLYNALWSEVPDIEPAAAVDMELFQKDQLGSKSFIPEGYFIALDGDRWIGMSTLWKGNEPNQLATSLTGVLPPYRRRGIALALKVRSLKWARDQGNTRIRTTNASTNTGMLAINGLLGFERRPAWVHYIHYF